MSSVKSQLRTLKISVFMLLLILLLLAESQQRQQCRNGVQVIVSDGSEQYQTVECFMNCTNENCTRRWFMLPLSSNQQPASSGATLRWTPDDNRRGQFVCLDENNITVKAVLIISENAGGGKHLYSSVATYVHTYCIIQWCMHT